jgi:hypothetical protein
MMSHFSFVIAGLNPAIHATLPLGGVGGVDARVKPGHDKHEGGRR